MDLDSDSNSTEPDQNEQSTADFDAEQLAELVAVDQIELPLNLPHDRLQVVIDRVRERRRQHLLRHIARCIAAEIMRDSDCIKGVADD